MFTFILDLRYIGTWLHWYITATVMTNSDVLEVNCRTALESANSSFIELEGCFQVGAYAQL